MFFYLFTDVHGCISEKFAAMIIKQFEDKNLSHYSYAVIDSNEMVIIDPSRNPHPYYDFADENNVVIKAVIETHPHADFVSSHLEIHQVTNARIYSSKLIGAKYPQQPFDEGQSFTLGKLKLTAWNTPGHSPDSITIILENEKGKDIAAFTGDTLFIGDCGRPDLREKAGNIHQKREELARRMFHSLKRFHSLNDEVIIYPAHGSGSFCGRNLSTESSNTIGKERKYNWCLQPMQEREFVKALLEGQPFIPKYFGYDVDMNVKGAPAYFESIGKVSIGGSLKNNKESHFLNREILIVDTRTPAKFKAFSLDNSINIPEDLQFETWLGTIIAPYEKFYLVAENLFLLKQIISRTAKIGYESFIVSAYVLHDEIHIAPSFDLTDFSLHPDDYTIVDVRTEAEAAAGSFTNSLHIPLHSLRNNIKSIPENKPIVVHCASGYRSAIGSSIIRRSLKNNHTKVHDLGEAIKSFDLSD